MEEEEESNLLLNSINRRTYQPVNTAEGRNASDAYRALHLCISARLPKLQCRDVCCQEVWTSTKLFWTYPSSRDYAKLNVITFWSRDISDSSSRTKWWPPRYFIWYLNPKRGIFLGHVRYKVSIWVSNVDLCCWEHDLRASGVWRMLDVNVCFETWLWNFSSVVSHVVHVWSCRCARNNDVIQSENF